MSNLTVNNSRPKSTAIKTGGLAAGVVAPLRFRQRAATVVIVLASTVWISGLAALGYAQSALPWCITLAVTACGAMLSGNRSKYQFGPRALQTADRQAVSFIEAYAVIYMVVSVVLSAWIIYHLLYKPAPLTVKRQAVDIELTSVSDFQDRHDPLPGTKEKPTLRKRTGDPVSSQGSIAPQLISQKATQQNMQKPVDGANETPVKTQSDNKVMKAPQLSDAKMVIMQPLKPVNSDIAATNPLPVPVQMQAASRQTPVNHNPQARAQSEDEPFLQEVKPPELVELMDNDGDKSLDVWQPGGSSTGGTGSKSWLAAYLKELNRRFKSAWMPPRGEPWKTEVLFRIKKTGQLVSARIIQTSGSAEADAAAIKAIASSAPFRKLPADYPHAYLDVRYSFNYSVDQLTEVNDAQFQ